MACQTEGTVQIALGKFLQQHDLEDHASDIDDIVLSYVISILEELGHEGDDENVDVDGFIEMMDAYIPGFSSIDSVTVCEWMFELAAELSRPESEKEKHAEEPKSPSLNEKIKFEATSVQPREHLDSTGEDNRKSSESSNDDVDEQLQTLLEMFPDILRVEAEHCLQGAERDMDRAVQLILHRQEAGVAITEEKKSKSKRTKTVPAVTDEIDKKRLMARYAYIDVDEDKKSFKPSAPKPEPKKMIRYLDNQVVNTKGNRYTEVKKEDTEEMKKTYISLKPARKYRFH